MQPSEYPKHGMANPINGCSSSSMKPPKRVDRQRSRYFAPLGIFFAGEPAKRSEAHGKSGTIADDTKSRLVEAERRRLHSGCELITLKAKEKSPAFSLSKGK
jgi:hypothetical protein